MPRRLLRDEKRSTFYTYEKKKKRAFTFPSPLLLPFFFLPLSVKSRVATWLLVLSALVCDGALDVDDLSPLAGPVGARAARAAVRELLLRHDAIDF